jgi:uncharacterized membrane protein YqhA
MTRTFGSLRVALGAIVLVAFNVAMLAVFLEAETPAETPFFFAWFVGDAVLTLIVLGLTER